MRSKLIWLIVFMVVATGGIVLAVTQRGNQAANQVMTDAERFREDYPTVPADNLFRFVSDSEVIEVFESGSGVVFLGFKACPWCQELAPLVNQAAQNQGLDRIYYYDILKARESGSDTYQKLVNILKEYLSTDDKGQPRIFVPDVSIVKDGKIVGRFEQEAATDGANTPDTYWTSERQEKAIKQLQAKMTTLDSKTD